MRRRRRDAGGSLDSLLDTMTNVVGILVIVLVVTQLGVGDAVKRMAEALPDISDEEIEKVSLEREELAKLLENQDTTSLTSQIATDLMDSEKIKKTIEQLKKQLKDKPKTNLDLSNLEKELKKKKDLAAAQSKKLNAANQKLAMLEAQLQKLPIGGNQKPSFEIKLPDPRPAPKDYTKVTFIARGGRLYRLSGDETYRKIVYAQIRRFNPGWKSEKPCKCQAAAKTIQKKPLGDNNVRILYEHTRNRIKIEAKPNKGETLEILKSGKSKFEGYMKAMARKKEWLRLIVWSDNYEMYIEARAIADKYNVPTGWDIYGGNSQHGAYYVYLRGIKCTDIPKPKPAPAKKGPTLPPPPDVKVKPVQID